jgi:formylmethanofuran dehydrogenase subunit B
LAIADRIGACVGLAGHDRGRLRPFQRLGQISATLGEVKDRADLIVYDVLFPIAQLPRLRERYADDSVGPFVPRGRAGRTIIRLSRYPEGTPACPADLDIIVRPRQPACFYQTLRAAVNGVDLDPTEVERTTQHPLATFLDLANRLKRARYGAFFVANRGGSEVDMEAILALVRDLNAFTRFVVIHPTFDGANRSGAEAVLAWQAGAGGHVDFSLGHPRYLPEEEAIGRLASREVDAALLLIDGPADLDWTIARHDAAGHLGQIPRVVIRPADAVGASWTPRGVAHSINALMYAAEVDLPSARPGIDEGGTVVRFDGVMLPLRPPIAERRRTQRGILLDLDTRLAAKPSCQDVTA